MYHPTQKSNACEESTLRDRVERKCLNLREQRRHLPTQPGKGWSRKSHPGLASARGSLYIHDVHLLIFFDAHTRLVRTIIEQDHPSTLSADGARDRHCSRPGEHYPRCPTS
eukprot:6186990-Pleurochrysis_carterae.AAC.1